MYGKVFLSLLLLSSLLLPIRGQQPQPSASPTLPSTPTAPQDDVQDVVRITTSLVQVDAVVTKDGRLVTDLKPEDFEITEDGHPQAITNFSYVSNVTETKSPSTPAKATGRDKAPALIIPPALHPNEARRTIALVVDDLGMSQSSIIQLRSRLRKLVNEELQPNDLVAIIRTGGEVGALQQFTNDKRLLQGAVDRLRWNPCSRTGLHVFTPAGSDYGQNLCSLSSEGGTLQSLLFILQGMRDLPGRKSMILFTDDLQLPQLAGMSNSQQPDLSTSGVIGASSNVVAQRVLSGMPAFEKIVEFAIRGSVVVYSVDTRGLQYTGVTAADRLGPVVTRPAGTIRQELLSTSPTNVFMSTASNRSAALVAGREGGDFISRRTGGFGVHNANDLGLKQIAEDQQGYYLLAYRPAGETFNRKFHHIKIAVKRKGLAVRTRDGFYGLTDEEEHSRKPLAADRLVMALISPFGSNEIALRLTTLFANSPSSGSFLKAFLQINATDLTFVDAPDGTHRATFDLGITAFGDNGRVVSQERRVAILSLHGAFYEQALRAGVVYPFEVPITQPGAMQFRVALRDQASQRIGTAGQFIEVPNLKNQRLALSGLVLWSASSSAAPGNQEDAISSSPGVRRFRQGAEIGMAYTIYPGTANLAQVTTQTRIFHDGKLIYTGKPTPLDLTAQSDLKRITNAGRILLGADFPAGDYVLQVGVTEILAKVKQRTTTQAIDFEITN